MFPLVIGSALLGFAVGRLTNARKKKEALGNSSSPIPGVGAESWGDFVARMAVADQQHVGRQGTLAGSPTWEP